MKKASKKALYRIVDVNLNRLKEGLRVCEDVSRFYICDKKITASLKAVRQSVIRFYPNIDKGKRLNARNIIADVGKHSTKKEKMRKDFKDLFMANIQRSKESLRVLEEITKLVDKSLSEKFKKMRYRIYDLEKRAFKKIKAVCCAE